MALNSHSHSQLSREQKSIFADALFNPVSIRFYKFLYDHFTKELKTNNANKVVKRIHKYVEDPKNFDLIKLQMQMLNTKFTEKEDQIIQKQIEEEYIKQINQTTQTKEEIEEKENQLTSIKEIEIKPTDIIAYSAYRNDDDLVNEQDYNNLQKDKLFNNEKRDKKEKKGKEDKLFSGLRYKSQTVNIFNAINQTIKDNKYKEDKKKKYINACNGMLFDETLRDEVEQRLHQNEINISKTKQWGAGNRKTAMADIILFDTMSKHIQIESFYKNSKILKTKAKNITTSKTQKEFKKTYKLFLDFLSSFIKLFPGCKKKIKKEAKDLIDPIMTAHDDNKKNLSVKTQQTENEFNHMKENFNGENPQEYISIQNDINGATEYISTGINSKELMKFDERKEIDGIYFNKEETDKQVNLLKKTDNTIESTRLKLVEKHRKNRLLLTEKVNATQEKFQIIKQTFADEKPEEYTTIQNNIDTVLKDISTEMYYGRSKKFDENGKMERGGIYFNQDETKSRIELLKIADKLMETARINLIKKHRDNKNEIINKINSLKDRLATLKRIFPSGNIKEHSKIQNELNIIENEILNDSLIFSRKNTIEREGKYYSDQEKAKKDMLLNAVDDLLSLAQAKVIKDIHDGNKKVISTKAEEISNKLNNLKQLYPDPSLQAYKDVQAQLDLLNNELCNAKEFDDNGITTKQGTYFDSRTKDQKIKLLDCIDDYLELLEADYINDENYKHKSEIKSKHSTAKIKLSNRNPKSIRSFVNINIDEWMLRATQSGDSLYTDNKIHQDKDKHKNTLKEIIKQKNNISINKKLNEYDRNFYISHNNQDLDKSSNEIQYYKGPASYKQKIKSEKKALGYLDQKLDLEINKLYHERYCDDSVPRARRRKIVCHNY